MGFLERWDATITTHIAFARIVCGKNMVKIGEFAFQVGKKPGAPKDVLAGIEGVGHFQIVGGFGHELHQALGANAGNGIRVEQGFGMDNRLDQGRFDTVLAGGEGDYAVITVTFGIAQRAGLIVPPLPY